MPQTRREHAAERSSLLGGRHDLEVAHFALDPLTIAAVPFVDVARMGHGYFSFAFR
jgi:hypothetical protein